MMHKITKIAVGNVIQKINAVFLGLDCEYFVLQFLLWATITSAASYLFTNNNIRKKSDVIWQL